MYDSSGKSVTRGGSQHGPSISALKVYYNIATHTHTPRVAFLEIPSESPQHHALHAAAQVDRLQAVSIKQQLLVRQLHPP